MSTVGTALEKVYFEDPRIKVTNVRVTCQHFTIPVEKINSVSLNFKAEGFFLSLTFLAFSFCPFFFFPLLSPKLQMSIGGICLVMIVTSSIFAYLVYKEYVQLTVSVVGRDIVLIASSMSNRKYLEGICDKIGDAVMDEKKYKELKETGEVESFLALNPTDTIKIKLMLDDYENLKKLRDEFTVKRDSAVK